MSNHYGENPAPEEDIYKPGPAPVHSEGSVSGDRSPRPSGINSASSDEIAGGYSPRPVVDNHVVPSSAPGSTMDHNTVK